MTPEDKAPDLTEAQKPNFGFIGPDWLAWRDHECTKRFFAWVETSVKASQDRWLDGDFSSMESNNLARGGALALAGIVLVVENIKLDNKPESEDGK